MWFILAHLCIFTKLLKGLLKEDSVTTQLYKKLADKFNQQEEESVISFSSELEPCMLTI